MSTIELFTRARHAKELGINGTENLTFDWPALIARKGLRLTPTGEVCLAVAAQRRLVRRSRNGEGGRRPPDRFACARFHKRVDRGGGTRGASLRSFSTEHALDDGGGQRVGVAFELGAGGGGLGPKPHTGLPQRSLHLAPGRGDELGTRG